MIHILRYKDYDRSENRYVIDGPDVNLEKLLDEWLISKIGNNPCFDPNDYFGYYKACESYELARKNIHLIDFVKFLQTEHGMISVPFIETNTCQILHKNK